MKLALIHYSAPPVIGGVERVVGEQVALFRDQGHHVTLACFEGGEGVRTDSFIPLSREATPRQLTAYLLAALSGMDAVLMHNVGTMPFSLNLTSALRSLAEQLPSIRWICWVHDLVAGSPDYARFLTPDSEAILRTACQHWEYVAVSPQRAGEVRDRLGIACTVIPNGLDLAATLNLCPKVAALAESKGWWDAELTLLHPARIVRRKSIETGIEVTAALADANVDARYLLTGAPDPHSPDSIAYGMTLQKLSTTRGVADRVYFLREYMPIGAVQLASLYAVADALFFPSVQEGFGLPILEAAAFRIPAFCADREPMRSLPGAIVFDPELPPARLSEWIIRQIETREAITSRNRLVKTYRWNAIYRNFLAPFLSHPQTSQ